MVNFLDMMETGQCALECMFVVYNSDYGQASSSLFMMNSGVVLINPGSYAASDQKLGKGLGTRLHMFTGLP